MDRQGQVVIGSNKLLVGQAGTDRDRQGQARQAGTDSD
jgi:hypothetical protein